MFTIVVQLKSITRAIVCQNLSFYHLDDTWTIICISEQIEDVVIILYAALILHYVNIYNMALLIYPSSVI